MGICIILWYMEWLVGVKLHVVYVRTTQASVGHRNDEEARKGDKGHDNGNGRRPRKREGVEVARNDSGG